MSLTARVPLAAPLHRLVLWILLTRESRSQPEKRKRAPGSADGPVPGSQQVHKKHLLLFLSFNLETKPVRREAEVWKGPSSHRPPSQVKTFY